MTTPGAHTGLASNVATNFQPPAGDPGTQAGTMTQTASPSHAATGLTAGDTFVFGGNFGHETITNFHPDTDVSEIDHTTIAEIQHLLDTAPDNAVSTFDTDHSTAAQDMTKVQLPHHQGDFHFA